MSSVVVESGVTRLRPHSASAAPTNVCVRFSIAHAKSQNGSANPEGSLSEAGQWVGGLRRRKLLDTGWVKHSQSGEGRSSNTNTLGILCDLKVQVGGFLGLPLCLVNSGYVEANDKR